MKTSFYTQQAIEEEIDSKASHKDLKNQPRSQGRRNHKSRQTIRQGKKSVKIGQKCNFSFLILDNNKSLEKRTSLNEGNCPESKDQYLGIFIIS
jgi:hypothetical protein